MRRHSYDPSAPKQTVSLTLNSDLYGKAKSVGLNASRVAEQALAQAYAVKTEELLKAEIAQELAALDAFVDRHHSFAEMARAYREAGDATV